MNKGSFFRRQRYEVTIQFMVEEKEITCKDMKKIFSHSNNKKKF